MFSCKESFELATQLNRFAIVDEDELLAWAETVEHREYCRMALCGGSRRMSIVMRFALRALIAASDPGYSRRLNTI